MLIEWFKAMTQPIVNSARSALIGTSWSIRGHQPLLALQSKHLQSVSLRDGKQPLQPIKLRKYDRPSQNKSSSRRRDYTQIKAQPL